MIDKNGKELKNGDIIDIHQTVNGEDIFIVVNIETLDLRYGCDLSYKYQYSVSDLLTPNHFNGDIEWEIVGNLYSIIDEKYR